MDIEKLLKSTALNDIMKDIDKKKKKCIMTSITIISPKKTLKDRLKGMK